MNEVRRFFFIYYKIVWTKLWLFPLIWPFCRQPMVDGVSLIEIIATPFTCRHSRCNQCGRDGQRGFFGLIKMKLLFRRPFYVDTTIYYPRQFCVPFNLVV